MNKERKKDVNDHRYDEGWQDALEEVLRQIDKQNDGKEPPMYRQALAGTIRLLWSMSQERDEAMRKLHPGAEVYPMLVWEEETKLQKMSQFWIDGISDVDLDPKAEVNEWRGKRLKRKDERTT